MMVLHANGDRSFAVSFPRDLWVTIPGRGAMKINAAFNDGPQKVVDTLQQNFKSLSTTTSRSTSSSFEGIVDAIGACPVWFDVHAPRTTSRACSSRTAPRCYQLNGAQSLAYVRARRVRAPGSSSTGSTGHGSSADATADIGRIERQQDFVKKLGRIAVERALDDPLDRARPRRRGDPRTSHADAGFDRSAFNELVRAFMGLSLR